MLVAFVYLPSLRAPDCPHKQAQTFLSKGDNGRYGMNLAGGVTGGKAGEESTDRLPLPPRSPWSWNLGLVFCLLPVLYVEHHSLVTFCGRSLTFTRFSG